MGKKECQVKEEACKIRRLTLGVIGYKTPKGNMAHFFIIRIKEIKESQMLHCFVIFEPCTESLISNPQ